VSELLGVDEFGRSTAAVVFQSAGYSLARAGLVVVILLLISALLAYIAELKLHGRGSAFVVTALDTLDSVPAFLWVLTAVSVVPHGGYALIGLVFIVAALPLTFNSMTGAFREVLAQPYCDAARALGTSDLRLMRLHVLPNSVPYILPLCVHLIGSALAVYGAVGIFGMVSRRDLDLGVLLMRGKEQAHSDVSLLLVVIGVYAAIFFILHFAAKQISSSILHIEPQASRGDR
jgi:peptide/nickel transport system permease protein